MKKRLIFVRRCEFDAELFPAVSGRGYCIAILTLLSLGNT